MKKTKRPSTVLINFNFVFECFWRGMKLDFIQTRGVLLQKVSRSCHHGWSDLFYNSSCAFLLPSSFHSLIIFHRSNRFLALSVNPMCIKLQLRLWHASKNLRRCATSSTDNLRTWIIKTISSSVVAVTHSHT